MGSEGGSGSGGDVVAFAHGAAALKTSPAVYEETQIGEAELAKLTFTAPASLASEDGPAQPSRVTTERRMEALMKGYQGDACGECGNFTLVRNGTCLKCDTCGSTTGCS